MHPLDQAWDSLKRDFEAACSRHARAASLATTVQLNQLLRRLRQYKTEGEWISILAESASTFAAELAVLEVQGSSLKLRAMRGLSLPQDLSVPVAPAFANAIETKDPVVALRSPSEVGQEFALCGARARLIPIENGERVVALLFVADSEELDPNALELIAGIASAVLARKTNISLHSQIEALPPPSSKEPRALPAWGDLTEPERALHLRAQRFSRVAVAEAQLSRPEACSAGRDARDLYLFLKTEIEKARDTYRKQFMVIPSMVDYLHLELVRVIAGGDEAAMGVEYPGAMV
jgi:hypothetical protein